MRQSLWDNQPSKAILEMIYNDVHFKAAVIALEVKRAG